MATIRANARRNEEENMDQEALSQDPQALVGLMTENVTNPEIRFVIKVLS